MSSLGTELPKLIQECQQIKELYLGLPDGVGKIGAVFIQQDIDAAINALASGDVIQMLQCYEQLKKVKESL